MDSQVLVALALSLVGGLSTSLGALIVVLNHAPNLKMLGLLQGFAAGLMLSISFFDLAHNALNSIGFLKGNLWFFAGVTIFGFIVNFIPEPKLVPVDKTQDDDGSGKDLMKKHRRQVLFSGIVTAVGISLHNFPEGMAVFLGSIKGLRVGLNLALAIALHNIPEDTVSASSGIAQRARHPDELKGDDNNWMIDIDYYLSQQIHPIVSRLCASIQGTSPARLADCLGLDSSKFQNKTVDSASKDSSSILLSVVDEGERYNGCELLWLSCPSCSGTFACPPACSLLSNSRNESPSDSEKNTDCNFWQSMRCPRCPNDVEGCRVSPAMMANQVKRQVDNFISLYYKGLLTCDDETCKYTTRALNLRVIGDTERGTTCANYPRCNGRLIRQYTEGDLYKQLSYFCYIMDTTRCMEKLPMDQNSRVPIEKQLAAIRSSVELAASEIQKIRTGVPMGGYSSRISLFQFDGLHNLSFFFSFSFSL